MGEQRRAESRGMARSSTRLTSVTSMKRMAGDNGCGRTREGWEPVQPADSEGGLAVRGHMGDPSRCSFSVKQNLKRKTAALNFKPTPSTPHS